MSASAKVDNYGSEEKLKLRLYSIIDEIPFSFKDEELCRSSACSFKAVRQVVMRIEASQRPCIKLC